ncbi:hypothetical protein AVEN_249281-1 [Araneus ventricosus]|uniref:Uncharacterized protein n=1 Tax=Araneus ventricosus TaxID=182803 RepID=A0A4Y2K5Q8_ARAVE|nr:hypothetical protein AVEN_249281-1 [Araneus ventricosus]
MNPMCEEKAIQNPPFVPKKKFQFSPHLTSRYQCTKLFTENYKRKEVLIPTGPWIRSLSNPVGRVQGLVFHIAAPPRALIIATSTGHHPAPLRHTTRTDHRKHKGAYSTFYLGTASSGTSSIPLPATYLGIAVGHHSSDDESSDRRNLAPQRPPCHQTVP